MGTKIGDLESFKVTDFGLLMLAPGPIHPNKTELIYFFTVLFTVSKQFSLFTYLP